MKQINYYIALILSFFLTGNLGAQCNMVAGASTLLAANSLTCTNTSTNTIAGTSYTWNFYGTGINSTSIADTFFVANPPPVTYTANGDYVVELLVSNNPTCTPSTFTTLVTICSFTPSFYDASGPGGSATFSTNASGPDMTSLTWLFGDGGSGASYSVTHNYFNGTYHPMLIVTYGNNGCGFNIPGPAITITNNPCNAHAAFNYITAQNGVVNFSATSSGTNLAYSWNFGDGVTSTQQNPTHAYASAGNYTVMLHVNNVSFSVQCADTNRTNVNVTGIPCIANSSFTLLPGSTPHFYTLIPAYIYNVSSGIWNWGDGSSTSFNSSFLNPSHTYTSAGSYNICLTLTTTCGATSSICVSQYLSRSAANNMVYVNVELPQLINGIEEQPSETGSLQLFPNPTDGMLNLKLDKPSEPEQLSVYDLLGKLVYTLLPSTTEEELHLDLRSLNNGVYFLKIDCVKKNCITSKFIIAR